jgi:shikimate dehydrogenase
MKLFGLIGNPLSHSYSQDYFNLKFEKENLMDCQYRLFPVESLEGLQDIISDNPELVGLNVTIPFKKMMLNYLHEADPVTKETGAVNCIKIDRTAGSPLLLGYNTDVYGFEHSLKPLLKSWHTQALILGSGGAAGAVAYVLKSLKIDHIFVSRNPGQKNQIGYPALNRKLVEEHLLIIQTTPVGMFPDTGMCPDIPYKWITSGHLFFDLIYNPGETLFLKKGREKGAQIKNGLEMFYLQAEKSWEVWQH